MQRQKKGIRLEQLAKLFRAVSNPKRIRIVKAISQGFHAINKVSDFTGLPYKTVERHIKILVSAGIVKQERPGAFVDLTININPKDTRYSYIKSILDSILASV